ncbi:Glutamate receptor ionotropic, kainate 1, partial [Cichlidogyrus casuarinus]
THDLAIGAFTQTESREKVIDFTNPFLSIGLSILFVKPTAQAPSLFSFLQPLTPGVWATVLLMYLLVTWGLFVVSRMSPYEWNRPHPCDEDSEEMENQFFMLNSLWFYIAALLNQGTDISPKATSTRLLTGIWWFFALIVISTYTANLAAFLTVENTKSPINSVDDLVKQNEIKYGTLRSGSSKDFFKDSKDENYKKMGETMQKEDSYATTVAEGISRVEDGNFAFILESSLLEYYNYRKCNLKQIGGMLDTKYYSIGLKTGSPWKDRMTAMILQMQANEDLTQMYDKWWKNVSEGCTTKTDSNKEAKALGVQQVGGVFILLLIGFFVGTTVAVVEFFIKARKRYHGKELWHKMWQELSFSFQCMTSSKKPKDIRELAKARPVSKMEQAHGIEVAPGVIISPNHRYGTGQFGSQHGSNISGVGNLNYPPIGFYGGQVALNTSRTSNWSGDYFLYTGGVSFVSKDLPFRGLDHTGNYLNSRLDTLTLRGQTESIFLRDWNSEYAHEL